MIEPTALRHAPKFRAMTSVYQRICEDMLKLRIERDVHAKEILSANFQHGAKIRDRRTRIVWTVKRVEYSSLKGQWALACVAPRTRAKVTLTELLDHYEY